MSVAAYILLVVLFTGYVLLDGYDLGMGALLLFVARTPGERRAALESIAPFWNGNEVWLVAGGAALFALFPLAYASAFSGFYLPFMVLLWLLMGRGIAFEIRGMVDHPLWHGFWDVVFALSSALLAVLLGIALGNVVRGVPLGRSEYFLGLFGFLLNPYALGVGLLALLGLAQHGAAYLALRTTDTLAARSRLTVVRLWPGVVVVYLGISGATFLVRPPQTFGPHLAVALAAVVTLAGLLAVRPTTLATWPRAAFVASSAFMGGLLLSAAATIYPYLLPGYPSLRGGIDIFRAAPSPVALATALATTVLGLALLAVYRSLLARRLSAHRGTSAGPHE